MISITKEELDKKLLASYINPPSILLYKGVASDEELDDYYFIDPATFTRNSKTVEINGNAYNLLLNNLPSWSSLPHRKHSVIVSTDIHVAETFSKGKRFGKVFIVLPQKQHRLVICAKSDVWFSFDYALRSLNLRNPKYTLVYFNQYLHEIANAAGYGESYDNTWENFNEFLTLLVKCNFTLQHPLTFEAGLILAVLQKNSDNLVGYLDEIFSPSNNNVVLKEISEQLNPKEYINNEAWTDSPCLLWDSDNYFYVNTFRATESPTGPSLA